MQTYQGSLFQPVIQSFGYKEDYLIRSIIDLHCPNGIDCDVTYSIGKFYKSGIIPQPKYKFDIAPAARGVVAADASNLPLESNSMRSVMFDPPFMAGGPSPRSGTGMVRFGRFRYVTDLWKFYEKAISEFSRILIDDGILIVKCQDTVSQSRNHFSHVEIYKYAELYGLEALDLFILLSNNRLNDSRKQQHARKYHSYFWVFIKGDRRRSNKASSGRVNNASAVQVELPSFNTGGHE